MDLKGKKALVTGASSGIGQGIALALASEGTDLFLSGRDATRLAETKAEAERRGVRAQTLALDLSLPAAPGRLIQEAVDTLGGLSILVNAAGIGMAGPLHGARDQDVEDVFRLNLFVPIALTREAYPHLKASQGAVVNISSVAGQIALPYTPVYSATKFALAAASRAARLEAKKDGVRIITAFPGATTTPFLDSRRGEIVRTLERGPQAPEVSVEVVARKIVAALKGNRDFLNTSPRDSLQVFLARLFPALSDTLLARLIKNF